MPVELVRREALFRAGHQPEAEKPLVQRNVRPMEDRADPHREPAAAIHAMVPAAALRLGRGRDRLYAVKAAADRAIGTIWPADGFQLYPGSFVIVVAGVGRFDGKLQHGLSP